MSDTAWRHRIEQARARTVAWLDTLAVRGLPDGVARISAHHDPMNWPGMLLPGTYNAVLCRALLDAHPYGRSETAAWLLSHRRPDGVFRVPGMEDDAVFKRADPVETWRYIDFHITNYCLGAVQALDPLAEMVLAFARPFLEPVYLKAWLADRDLRDPWLEGTNIVNLASFLLLMGRRANPALEILLRWHDYHQEPTTGFWGVGQTASPRQALHAMAGSMQNFHIWYATGHTLPHHERAVDYALSCPVRIDSACIDVDLVDLLVHAHDRTAYRRAEVEAWLRGMLPLLLDLQNQDGGFPDQRAGIRRQDGWVGGYWEPQGISNTFATWFRWIAIAMIVDLFWPGAFNWNFRQMIGIGYRMPKA